MRLGSDAASPVKASLNNQEREERNFKHSQFSCHLLRSYITWTSSRSKPAKGFLTNFSEKLPITLRSRGTDPHPAAGVDRFSSAPPPPCPSPLPPSCIFPPDPCEGHAYNTNLPEDETLHRERAGTTGPEQFRNIIKARFSCNGNFPDDQVAMVNLLYVCSSLRDTRLILNRSQ